MSKALARVKRELGPQAVILRTRTLRRGGLLGVGARQVVEITASKEVARVAGTEVLRSAGLSEQQTAGASRTGPAPPPQVSSLEPSTASLSDEVHQIRQMVHRMMRLQVTQPRPDLPNALFNQFLGLLEQEVEEELAEQIIQSARKKLAGIAADDAGAVREEVAGQIAQLVRVAGESASDTPMADDRPLTIALIGPTGVGKTTTIAKLAAHYKLRRGLRVALVTLDTYRIAAVDQIKTYAQILGATLHVALTPEQMSQTLNQCHGFDAVLVDTAGRSPRDCDRLDDLRQILTAARPHEVHLVLASNTGQAAMMEAVERFTPIGFDRLIFTKLDEAVKFGLLLNVVKKVDARLSYLTTGQEVPHRIEPGDPRRLAGLILGEKL